MKSLIVYYSYSGNTRKLAKVLKEMLSKKGEVDMFELKPEDESDNFFVQAARAFVAKKAVIEEAPFNAAGYDLVCIGTPVWAFAPAPAINTYLDGLENLEGKDAVYFITYDSGMGAGLCLKKMKKILKRKGAFKLYSFMIQQARVNDEDFVKKAITEALREVL